MIPFFNEFFKFNNLKDIMLSLLKYFFGLEHLILVKYSNGNGKMYPSSIGGRTQLIVFIRLPILIIKVI